MPVLERAGGLQSNVMAAKDPLRRLTLRGGMEPLVTEKDCMLGSKAGEP
jgi:hypothetical protein